jgi:hypothetical protein
MLWYGDLGDSAVLLNDHPHLDLACERWVFSQPVLGVTELKELLPLSDRVAQH